MTTANGGAFGGALRSEFVRYALLYRRYPADAITNIAVLTVIFYALVRGAAFIGNASFQGSGRLDAIIVGYVLWSILIFALTTIAGDLQVEALTGTLEQLALTPRSLLQVLLARALAATAFNVAASATLLALVLALTGRTLHFPPTLVLPLAVAVCGAYSLSLALGALALLFKRVQHLVQVSHFLFLFLVMAQAETWPASLRAIGYLLPVMPAAALLRNLMARDVGLDAGTVVVAVANAAAYFTLGVLLFRWAENRARERALLGQY
jgi:ABC-2 type transport system permease protein